jgi:hypothetical protein
VGIKNTSMNLLKFASLMATSSWTRVGAALVMIPFLLWFGFTYFSGGVSFASSVSFASVSFASVPLASSTLPDRPRCFPSIVPSSSLLDSSSTPLTLFTCFSGSPSRGSSDDSAAVPESVKRDTAL